MEMRVMCSHLVLHDQFALRQQILRSNRVITNLKIDFFLKVARQTEVYDWFFGSEGLLNVVDYHVETVLEELPLETSFEPIGHYTFMLLLFEYAIDDALA